MFAILVYLVPVANCPTPVPIGVSVKPEGLSPFMKTSLDDPI